MMDEMKKMLDLQFAFNTETNGDNWLNGVTKEDKEIDWELAAVLELSEALDSLNWKWWKDIASNDDIDNIKVELVDTMCFMLSILMTDFKKDNTYDRALLLNKLNSIINYSRDVSYVFDSAKFKKLSFELISNTLIVKNSKSVNKNSVILFDGLLDLLYSIPGFNLHELFKMYIAKDALNTVRQQLGYKDGTYIKMWDGVEDNVHVMNTLLTLDINNMDKQELVDMIIEKYKKINKIQPTLL